MSKFFTIKLAYLLSTVWLFRNLVKLKCNFKLMSNMINKKVNLRKEVGITIKSKETSSQLEQVRIATYVDKPACNC